MANKEVKKYWAKVQEKAEMSLEHLSIPGKTDES